jgi:hypothetical protein
MANNSRIKAPSKTPAMSSATPESSVVLDFNPGWQNEKKKGQ